MLYNEQRQLSYLSRLLSTPSGPRSGAGGGQRLDYLQALDLLLHTYMNKFSYYQSIKFMCIATYMYRHFLKNYIVYVRMYANYRNSGVGQWQIFTNVMCF